MFARKPRLASIRTARARRSAPPARMASGTKRKPWFSCRRVMRMKKASTALADAHASVRSLRERTAHPKIAAYTAPNRRPPTALPESGPRNAASAGVQGKPRPRIHHALCAFTLRNGMASTCRSIPRRIASSRPATANGRRATPRVPRAASTAAPRRARPSRLSVRTTKSGTSGHASGFTTHARPRAAPLRATRRRSQATTLATTKNATTPSACPQYAVSKSTTGLKTYRLAAARPPPRGSKADHRRQPVARLKPISSRRIAKFSATSSAKPPASAARPSAQSTYGNTGG